jgi:hypothetical protein
MTPRTLKLVAISYLVKTLLLAAAWVAVPDLPNRASARAREAWTFFFEGRTR